MQPIHFEEVLERIVARDPRYHSEAYIFLREALEFTQKEVLKAKKNEVRHITGQELLDGLREYGLDQYGPMTKTVLNEWGIHRCEDFGAIVFNLVEAGFLSKTDEDSPEHFKDGYDFDEAFLKPFLPAQRPAGSPSTQPQAPKA